MHEQTDLVERWTMHCTTQRIFVDTAENGPFKIWSVVESHLWFQMVAQTAGPPNPQNVLKKMVGNYPTICAKLVGQPAGRPRARRWCRSTSSPRRSTP